MKDEFIQTLHPKAGKTNKKISLAKYNYIRAHLLAILSTHEYTHTELMEALYRRVQDTFEGGVQWYGEIVKLDLEARNLLERTKSKPEQYRLTIQMIEKTITRLETILQIIPDLLHNMDESAFSFKPVPDKWSKKEILGHLIDSATNNRQRFIRGQFENVPTIGYDQNQWNKLHHYLEMDTKHLIDFWTLYNKHLLEIMKHIPIENLQKACRSLDGKTLTIQFLMEDYVVHLEHHLHQIVSY